MRINAARPPQSAPAIFTHEGAKATPTTITNQLRRSVLACMLFEDNFYSTGSQTAQRIRELAAQVSAEELGALAIEARTVQNLRSVSLFLAVLLCRHHAPRVIEETVFGVIQRADEIAEFMAIYQHENSSHWKINKPTGPMSSLQSVMKAVHGAQGKLPENMPTATKPRTRAPLANAAARGLRRAFHKFDAYGFQKWDRKDAKWRARDVMFLVRPVSDNANAVLFSQIAEQELPVAETWEVGLSAAGNDVAAKRAVFEGLLSDGKLGYLALLRNLRNMDQVGVEPKLIRAAILARKGGADRVLPFRFTAAARAAPRYERELDTAMLASIEAMPRLQGRTLVLVDVSQSMNAKLSSKSDLTRMDAAATLGAIVNAEDLTVKTFSYRMVEVPPRRGMAGVDAIKNSQVHGNTQLISTVNAHVGAGYDRCIVITDEQGAHDARALQAPAKRNYMLNVASEANGIAYKPGWVTLTGFSERVLHFIHELELADLYGTEA